MDTVDYSQNWLNYLINQLHAYDRFDHKGQGLKNAVKNKIRGFANKQANMTAIMDRSGKPLAYRVGVPEQLMQNLSDTEHLIPHDKK